MTESNCAVDCRALSFIGQNSKIPAVFYGAESDKVFVFVHGQFGNKFEAESFARIAVPRGWQVLAFDLPEHGERKNNVADSANNFDPWHAVPEIRQILSELRRKNKRLALRATSIGAWFALLAAREIPIDCCLLVSPLLDMERMITGMMTTANVSEKELHDAGEIPTANGAVLSYDYLLYARNNRVSAPCKNTYVLRGENDAVIPFDTVSDFCKKNDCHLTVMPNGEHWFHTNAQCKFMADWEAAALDEFGR